MSDEQENEKDKSEIETRIAKIDRACDTLLKLIESDSTTDAQKGRLFAQVVSWAKVKDKLIPPDDGGKLRSMGDELKSGIGGRSSKRANPGPNASPSEDRNRDGHKIRKIIASLPSYGRDTSGDSKDSKRKNGSDLGDGGRVPVDGGGDGSRNDDGAAHSSIV